VQAFASKYLKFTDEYGRLRSAKVKVIVKSKRTSRVAEFNELSHSEFKVRRAERAHLRDLAKLNNNRRRRAGKLLGATTAALSRQEQKPTRGHEVQKNRSYGC
jgi:hypothetical protein